MRTQEKRKMEINKPEKRNIKESKTEGKNERKKEKYKLLCRVEIVFLAVYASFFILKAVNRFSK